jgi:hypothetical protein
MARYLCCFILLSFFSPALTYAQTPPENIRTIKFYRSGDQTALPIIELGSIDGLEVHFDDLDNRVRNYYYTFELCNADWSPSILKPFEYIKGFQNVRISNYRNSSISIFRYIHYQASVPDKNCAPSKSGNYLLKVYLDNDTSKIVFTRRFMVSGAKATIATQVQQPYNSNLFKTAQKLQISVQTGPNMQAMGPNDLKVVVLQNHNWQTALYLNRPTIYRGNYYEYSDEGITAMPAGKEFRWIDLRSLRLMSDRMLHLENRGDTTQVIVKPDPARATLTYIYYNDLDGRFTTEALESINPFWQGDYAYVHFSYFPAGNKAMEGKDVYLFGELTNYGMDTTGKMMFNSDKGAYEKTLLLKQGYYNYMYVTQPYGGHGYPDFSETEGNYWATENNYTVLVYYKPFGARADELVAVARLSSVFAR